MCENFDQKSSDCTYIVLTTDKCKKFESSRKSIARGHPALQFLIRQKVAVSPYQFREKCNVAFCKVQ